jgi:hypothetical protein
MSKNNPSPSQLFTVRVWREKFSEDVLEVRFQVKHVLSGERRIFRESDQLLRYLLTKVEEDGVVDESA